MPTEPVPAPASRQADPGDAADPRACLDQALHTFADLPAEAILKQDLLRRGVRFTLPALSPRAYKAKDYFIFSFDMVPGRELDEAQRTRAPEEIRISGGPLALRPTVVSVRLNPDSPYVVDLDGDELWLGLGKDRLSRVEYQPIPAYYGHRTSSGKQLAEIAPAIEWGYLLYLTVFRMCQYFGKEEECQFCDINHNYRQQREAGRPYTGVKDVSEILEALRVAAREDRVAGAYTVTGGSVTDRLAGLDEVEFYARYIEAIESELPGRWISKLVVQAQPPEAVRRLREAGLRILHPNYEVWDPRLFALLCPGKERYVGRDRWIRWTLEAAEILGPAHVIPNFVAGVEMVQPEGFATIDQAMRSIREGLDFFMSRGIVPRFTTWCPEPLTALGPRPPAPLAYYGELLRQWLAAFHRHRVGVPPGYGPPGAGRAVFSVSAFMDVIPANAGSDAKPPGGEPSR